MHMISTKHFTACIESVFLMNEHIKENQKINLFKFADYEKAFESAEHIAIFQFIFESKLLTIE